jgi:fengycin family lipopeptide synthetase D
MHGNISITFGELNKKSNRLGRLLRKKGVGPDSVVGLMVERSLEMAAGMFSILKAGGAYLPIDTQTPGKRKKIIIKESTLHLLLVNQGFPSACRRY